MTLAPAPVRLRQYSRPAVFAIWAAAALPMGVGAWIVAPRLASDPLGFTYALVGTFTIGLAWQFVLILALVWHEQRTLRWATLKAALWLQPPSDSSGRRRGKLWWWALALIGFIGLSEVAPTGPGAPASRDFGKFLGSPAGHDALRGNWGLLALVVVMAVFNTVLGEELLFRGLLLPRMRSAFGRGDWVANALLFGLYHWHQPWSMPKAILGGLGLAYATSRLRSAWMGIIAHSVQSMVFIVVTLLLVLG
jgi:membrane protease YdiL (CAAX protease family)